MEFGDALGGHDRARLEMHLEVEIESTQKMQLVALIDPVCRCTLKLGPRELEDALAGCDCARLEEYLEAVDFEGGTTSAETVISGYHVIVGM